MVRVPALTGGRVMTYEQIINRYFTDHKEEKTYPKKVFEMARFNGKSLRKNYFWMVKRKK